MITEKVSWQTARDKCARMGGQLAVIPDAKDLEVHRDADRDPCLVGATDEKVEGEWLWVDGTKMTFKAWTPGNPDNWPRARELSDRRRPSQGTGGMTRQRSGMPTADSFVGYICEWKVR